MRYITPIALYTKLDAQCAKGRIPRQRHRHRHPREDVGVDVCVVECGLKQATFVDQLLVTRGHVHHRRVLSTIYRRLTPVYPTRQQRTCHGEIEVQIW